MAYLSLTVAVMAVVGAFADPSPNGNNNPFQGFPFSQFPQITFPTIQLPTFPPLPNFPQFNPVFPTIPPIKIPSADDIINKNLGPNDVYNGIVVQSSSGFTKDKDGKLVKNGGTTVVTNTNGEVKKFSVGKNPPEIKVTNIVPPFKHPKLPKISMPKLPDINIPGLPDIPSQEIPVIEPLPLFFPPIQPPLTYDEIKNIKPGKNQAFVGTSSSSFSVSSNINGKKNYVGGTNTIVNNNGEIDEQTVALQNNSR